MFLPRYRPLFIICLIILDIFIARNIVLAKTSNERQKDSVLGTRIGITITPTSTPTLTPTFTPTPSPTTAPTPTRVPPTPTKVQVTTSSPVTYSGGAQSILDQINAFRSSKGLSAVRSDSNTCSFAATRAREISTGFDHSGFDNRISGHTLPYPSYHEVTENIELNPNPGNVVQMWIDSPGHNANMQKDTPYVCVVNFGNYYAYEGWRP